MHFPKRQLRTFKLSNRSFFLNTLLTFQQPLGKCYFKFQLGDCNPIWFAGFLNERCHSSNAENFQLSNFNVVCLGTFELLQKVRLDTFELPQQVSVHSNYRCCVPGTNIGNTALWIIKSWFRWKRRNLHLFRRCSQTGSYYKRSWSTNNVASSCVNNSKNLLNWNWFNLFCEEVERNAADVYKLIFGLCRNATYCVYVCVSDGSENCEKGKKE